MAVSLMTGLLIASGAGSAVANFFGNRAQGKASEKAAEQLQQGVREARDYAEPKYAEAQKLAREQFERSQALLAPYAQQGGQGLTALTALLGLPSAPAAAGPSAAAPANPNAAAFQSMAQGGLDVGRAILGGNLAKGSFTGSLPGGTAAPATQSSYVTLRAPTGQTQPVPADQVDFYLARGATRI